MNTVCSGRFLDKSSIRLVETNRRKCNIYIYTLRRPSSIGIIVIIQTHKQQSNFYLELIDVKNDLKISVCLCS